MQTEDFESNQVHDFWDNANKYSWSNGEYEFSKRDVIHHGESYIIKIIQKNSGKLEKYYH